MKNLLRNVAYASIIVAATAVTVTQLNRPAEAQGSGSTAVVTVINHGSSVSVFLENGDVWRMNSPDNASSVNGSYIGNVFYGQPPINVEPSTWSKIKATGGKGN